MTVCIVCVCLPNCAFTIVHIQEVICKKKKKKIIIVLCVKLLLRPPSAIVPLCHRLNQRCFWPGCSVDISRTAHRHYYYYDLLKYATGQIRQHSRSILLNDNHNSHLTLHFFLHWKFRWVKMTWIQKIHRDLTIEVLFTCIIWLVLM